MTYFENMVKSTGIYGLDLVYSALEMLREAAEHEKLSTSYFVASREAESEDMREMNWSASLESSQRAHGLLDAYYALTTREVICTIYSIEEEIDWLEVTFEVTFEVELAA